MWAIPLRDCCDAVHAWLVAAAHGDVCSSRCLQDCKMQMIAVDYAKKCGSPLAAQAHKLALQNLKREPVCGSCASPHAPPPLPQVQPSEPAEEGQSATLKPHPKPQTPKPKPQTPPPNLPPPTAPRSSSWRRSSYSWLRGRASQWWRWKSECGWVLLAACTRVVDAVVCRPTRVCARALVCSCILPPSFISASCIAPHPRTRAATPLFHPMFTLPSSSGTSPAPTSSAAPPPLTSTPLFCIKRHRCRYNNNLDWTEDKRNTPQAFSHWTYIQSEKQIMIVDIQVCAQQLRDWRVAAAAAAAAAAA